MKKKVLFILLLSFAVINLNAAWKNAKMTLEAKKIFGALDLKTDFEKVNTHIGPYYAMKYNVNTSKFINLGDLSIESISGNDISKFKGESLSSSIDFIQINGYSENRNGVCKSFTDGVSTFKGSASSNSARYGYRIEPTSLTSSGTIIATYGRYNPRRPAHVAILLSVEKDYIYVLDQNAYFKSEEYGGIVSIHKIWFGDKTTKGEEDFYDVKNAYNYHVVRIEKGLNYV